MLAPASSATKPVPGPQAADLLAWYDRHRRDLPWRAGPGEAADPYRVWLSEIMLQQTTVGAVRPYFQRFLDRFPSLRSLAEAPSEAVMQAWAGLGYYSRARNLHACAKAIWEEREGNFPGTAKDLATLPGIGPYTAAAIAAIAFDEPAAAVDGNVERVVARLFKVETSLPKAKPVIRELTQSLVPAARPGDFAQALMDLGATICTPNRPACALCPWMAPCEARAEGVQAEYPKKEKRAPGIVRRGAAFVVLRSDDTILLRTRPPKGLLGSMAEVPTSVWEPDYEPSRAMLDAPIEARWQRLPGLVRHVFTHFPLELTVFLARVPKGTEPPDGMRFTPRKRLHEEALSGAMRKVLVHALGEPAPPSSRGAPQARARDP